MPKNKLYWGYVQYPFLFLLGLFLLQVGVLTLNLIKNYDIENLIGAIIWLTINLGILGVLFVLGYQWNIAVYDEYFVLTECFGKKKEYKFSDVTIAERDKYFDVLNDEGKTIIKVSYLINNSETLVKSFKDYCKANKIKRKTCISKTVTCNYYAKNFGLFWLVFGLPLVALAIIGCMATAEVFWILIFGGPGLLFLIGGIWLLLYHSFWRIQLNDRTVLFTSFLRKQTEIEAERISIKTSLTGNTIRIYKDGKQMKLLNINFLQNSDVLLINLKLKM